jgi:hypothetical protein
VFAFQPPPLITYEGIRASDGQSITDVYPFITVNQMSPSMVKIDWLNSPGTYVMRVIGKVNSQVVYINTVTLK